MEETINQVYKLEKEFLESKQQLQRSIEQEVQAIQKKTIIKQSIDALNEEENKGRNVYQPLGLCYILRPTEKLLQDLEYLHEKEVKEGEEFGKQKEALKEKTFGLQEQLFEMSKELKIN